MSAPYHVPLEILCNASVSCAIPPTATEKNMANELRPLWSPIMQRVWSEPWNTLEPKPRHARLMERVVIPQLFVRLTLVDPSFLDIIFKPSDLTLAVLLRYWMYSVERVDNRLTLGVLAPLLRKNTTQVLEAIPRQASGTSRPKPPSKALPWGKQDWRHRQEETHRRSDR